MKQVAVILLIVSALIAPCFAAEDLKMTDGQGNGRFWSAMEESQKLGWLYGYHEGIASAVAILSKDTESFKNQMSSMFPDKLTYAETRTAIDRFYSTPENGPIPIASALLYVMQSAVGVNQKTLDEFVSGLRRSYSKP
jgi:hypothetical protein